MEAAKQLRISVRQIIEFVLKEGDLSAGNFRQSDRAQTGTRGHRRVQKSRPDDYEAEVAISHRVECNNLLLEIFGRVDGLFAARQPVIIEEIKTTTWPLDKITEEHNRQYWAQAQCYAFMYALEHQLAEIEIHLTYYQLDSRTEKTFRRNFSFEQLSYSFDELLTPYLAWMETVNDWHTVRDHAIRQIEFPYESYRTGQRDLAVSVYTTIKNNDKLFAQAPTGVGKTIATLFPAVKAIGMGLISKIFYLTAKTPGRTVAEKAIEDMRRVGLRFKSLTLTAKEKICFCDEVNCDPAVCIFARGYFSKINAAVADAFLHEAFTRDTIADLARKHEVCPFEFSLDLALWVDCIICDYNYAFDPRVYLRRFFEYSYEPYVFLIDEAHNLPDRAREMYSAELNKKTVLALRRTLKPHLPELANLLTEINRILLEKRKAIPSEQAQRVLLEEEKPEELLKAVWAFNQKAEEWLALNQPAEFRAELIDFYFQCRNYLAIAELFDTFYISYFEQRGQSDLKTRLYCLDPSPLLLSALERSRSAVFFSATLLPMDYFEQLLLGESTYPKLILPSPFPSKNLNLLIHNRISTKYVNREASYEPIADAIEVTCAAQSGNYLVFFPSYAYLSAVVDLLQARLPEHQLLIQDRGMAEEARDAFLARFSADNEETMIGFAVMGGIFGEGIDLVGDRLIGAIVVGVGLPQLGLERDLIKNYFNRQNGQGFAYAYQYPGFNRVMQAAGRVIRTETDRGVIMLIDERFTQNRYRTLFPPEWRHFQVVPDTKILTKRLARFGHKAH